MVAVHSGWQNWEPAGVSEQLVVPRAVDAETRPVTPTYTTPLPTTGEPTTGPEPSASALQSSGQYGAPPQRSGSAASYAGSDPDSSSTYGAPFATRARPTRRGPAVVPHTPWHTFGAPSKRSGPRRRTLRSRHSCSSKARDRRRPSTTTLVSTGWKTVRAALPWNCDRIQPVIRTANQQREQWLPRADFPSRSPTSETRRQ